MPLTDPHPDRTPPDRLITFALSNDDIDALLDLLAAASAGREDALRMAEGDDRRLAELRVDHRAQEALEDVLQTALDDVALALADDPAGLPESAVLRLSRAGRWVAGPGVGAAVEAFRAAQAAGEDEADRWLRAALAVAQVQARAALTGVRGSTLRPLARLTLALVAEAEQAALTPAGQTCAGVQDLDGENAQ